LLIPGCFENGQPGKTGKQFFFAKKKPKNFCCFSAWAGTGGGTRLRLKGAQVFCFFFKKELLALPALPFGTLLSVQPHGGVGGLQE
jgi:hypothetical protein